MTGALTDERTVTLAEALPLAPPKYGRNITSNSLHLAAAVIANCDVFLTNDYRLSRFTGITSEIVQP